MCRTTNLLLTLISISIFSFFASGALQPQHQHAHSSGCIPAERAALLSFKEGITSNNTNLLASWQGQDCCRWRGVSCSNRTGHVMKLHLRNPNATLDTYGDYYPCDDASALFGEISPSLLSLKHLEHLDLSMNCLGPYSQIPHLLGSMGNLRYLNLSGIPFTGTVPSQLGNLSKLQFFDLGQTGYSELYSTDITWLTKLPFLKFLGMSGVNLTGIADWPHTLNMIPSLRVIDLHRCGLDSANQSLPHLNLTKLEKLDLCYNDFEHSLTSAWFWKATSLKYLDLSENRLFGQFPDTLGNMTYLQVLDISWNTMMMTGNLENLCSLEILDLSANEINGDIASVFVESLPQCTWKNLQELDLSNNNFTGTLPNFTSDFSRLSILSLSGNNLVGPIPPQLGNLTRLTSLDLNNNHLTGSIPTELGALTTLTSLDISSNDFTGSIPTEIGNLRYLTELRLSNNSIIAPIPPELMHSTSLTYLDLSSNHLNGTYLDISNNTFLETIPSNLVASRLEILSMHSNQIGGYIPESICKLEQLIYLDLSNNILEGEIPQCFHIYKIQHLILSNNSLSGKIPAFLQNNTGLKFLDLSWNKFSGRLPTWIGNLVNLSFLVLSHNKFSDNIPVDITKLGHLQYLDLSRNNFSGAIPWHLSNLTFMTTLQEESMYMVDIIEHESTGGMAEFGADSLGQTLSVNTKGQHLIYGRTVAYFVSIDLSCNSLTGEIPTDIISLAALMNLNLSSNQLSGHIPNMIGAVKSLESLDLSQNKLSGEIPSSLSSLTSLSYLNLSYNSLSGRIPSGPQLDTLNAENPSPMYIGNSGLCGPPVHKNCLANDPSIHGDLESSKQEFDTLTFYFGLVLGLVVGLWMVFCALLFKKTWRIAYFRLFDEAYDRVYVFLVVKWASFAKNTTAE